MILECHDGGDVPLNIICKFLQELCFGWTQPLTLHPDQRLLTSQAMFVPNFEHAIGCRHKMHAHFTFIYVSMLTTGGLISSSKFTLILSCSLRHVNLRAFHDNIPQLLLTHESHPSTLYLCPFTYHGTLLSRLCRPCSDHIVPPLSIH